MPHVSSMSPSISNARFIPPTVTTAFAGNRSLSLIRPVAAASRTAVSISRCAVTPSFYLRTLVLRASSFMVASLRVTALSVPSTYADRGAGQRPGPRDAADGLAPR